MVFSQPVFLFAFLPVLLIVYVLTPRAYRNLVLVLFSAVFYLIGEQAFFPLMVASIALNYYLALWIEWARTVQARKWLLGLGLCADLGLLFYFKYAGFFLESANRALSALHLTPVNLHLHVLLPLGISFFTFHKISYKVDVYRGVVRAKNNPLDLALYILFFPQLIAGPIVRYKEVSDDIGTQRRFLSWLDVSEGIRIFIIGLGKKVLIADLCAVPADRIFALPSEQLNAYTAWMGLLGYSLQIYYDFSGYSDMAIGLARIFGFHFPANFNYPYTAESMTDFWRRWHMSLSRWFRDYLYIPLGGNRGPQWRTYINLIVVFALCGLWHGASATCLFWGLYHGAFLVVERLGMGRAPAAIPRVLRSAYTLFAVTIGWVFFRCDSMAKSLHYLAALAGRVHGAGYASAPLLDRDAGLALLFGVLGSAPAVPYLARVVRAKGWERAAAPLYYLALAAIFALSVIWAIGGAYSPFIYYRF